MYLGKKQIPCVEENFKASKNGPLKEDNKVSLMLEESLKKS